MTPLTLGFKAGTEMRAFVGPWGAATETDAAWANYATMMLGDRPATGVPLTGYMSSAILSSTAIVSGDSSKLSQLIAAGIESGVAPLPVSTVVYFDGDSLMAGNGSSGDGSLSLALLNVAGSSWSQNFYPYNDAVGGSTVSSIESHWPSNAAPWMACSAFPSRYYVLWGGHNEPSYQSSDTAAQLVTINRYVTQLLAARALGATPVMVTPVTHSGISGTVLGYENSYVTTLKSRCAAEGITCVDAHNIPDLYNHSPGYYSDSIHLTNAGYELVRQAFLSAIPTP
jgi:hypothetical protein